MEELQKKHRQEQKDLQARITQKKKSATKKTRKGVNDESTELERQLKEKQDLEISKITGHIGDNNSDIVIEPPAEVVHENGVETDMQNLSVTSVQPKDERTKKPNRQKARLARRAAEQESMATQAAKEVEDSPDLRQQESDAMRAQYTRRGLKEHDIRSDGHCLYAAVADQLSILRLPLRPQNPSDDMPPVTDSSIIPYKTTRVVAASYIRNHSQDFEPFLEQPLEDYLVKIQHTGEWGGHLELLALAKAYNVDINILESNGHVEKIDSGSENEPKPALWLAYYHKKYGLGEHYNSLRPVG
ncbi:MAG: hypothetical protein LQ338_000407 [Usnochroma carphineum]|nr:MAG: hypothetical protein LQ338_000407 [Usnochroma carphineum]